VRAGRQQPAATQCRRILHSERGAMQISILRIGVESRIVI
jgi:hypothetical protein